MSATSERWAEAVADLREELGASFDALVRWTRAPAEALDHRPPDGGWTSREVLEHVMLADRYLLVLARKIAGKSARRAAAGSPWPDGEPRFEHLGALARRELAWAHPAHMTPGGGAPLDELRATLAADRAACLALLDAQPRGEGTLHRIRMSVVPDDDRLDLYQYLAVVALHARRHTRQMARNLESWEQA